MTQLRKHPDSISNLFDKLTQGQGQRNAAFTDIDAMTHNRDGDRLLFQEFKRKNEKISEAQAEALESLARRPGCTCWYVQVLDDEKLLFWEWYRHVKPKIISYDDYRFRFREWWHHPMYLQPPVCMRCGMRLPV